MNAFADVFARLDQEKEKLCPEHPEEVVRGAMAHEAAGKPKRPQYPSPISNFNTKEGAEEIVRRLNQFWGDSAKFWIEKASEKTTTRSPTPERFYCVRSNLVNGLPAVRK